MHLEWCGLHWPTSYQWVRFWKILCALCQIDRTVLTKYENSFCLHNFSPKQYKDRLKQTSLTCGFFFILLPFSACCIKRIIDGALNKLGCKFKIIPNLVAILLNMNYPIHKTSFTKVNKLIMREFWNEMYFWFRYQKPFQTMWFWSYKRRLLNKLSVVMTL